MYKPLYWMTLMGCFIAVAGCANQPVNNQGMTADEVEAIHHEGVQAAVGTDVDLGEKTKAKVAAATTVKVLAGLLGGGMQWGGGPRNPAPSQGYTQLDGRATVFTAQEATTFKGPALATAEAMNRKMRAAGLTVASGSPYALNVHSKVWGLDYDKFSEKDDYRLYYDVEVDLMSAGKLIRSYDCQGVTQDKHGLQAWEADDNLAVRKDAAVIGDICAGNALASLDLVPANSGSVITAVSSNGKAGISSR